MQEARYWYASPAGRARHDGANEWAKRTLALPARKGKKGPPRIVHGDGAPGVRGEGFEVLFSYAQSGPVSLAGGGAGMAVARPPSGLLAGPHGERCWQRLRC